MLPAAGRHGRHGGAGWLSSDMLGICITNALGSLSEAYVGIDFGGHRKSFEQFFEFEHSRAKLEKRWLP